LQLSVIPFVVNRLAVFPGILRLSLLSRVVVLAHHPSDVIAGALVGAAGAFLVRRWFAAHRLVFCPRSLRPYPGPSLRRIKAACREVAFGPQPMPLRS